jgi:hypothetical protein
MFIMGTFIESLESRTLMSVAPSVGVLKAEAEVAKADLVADGKVGVANYKLIYAALKADGEQKTSKALLKDLSVEGKAAFNVTSRGVKGAGTLLLADVNRLIADARSLAKHPTNLTFQAKVTAAESTLSLDASNRLTLITADITAEHDTNSTNLTAIEMADAGNSLLASDVENTIAPSSSAARTALIDAVTTTLTTDVAAVVAAYPS